MKYLILTGLTMVSCAGEQFKTDSKQIDSGILESDNPTGATRQDGSIFDANPHTADNDGAPHLTDSSNIEILDGATDNSLSYDSSNTTTDSGNNCTTTTFYADNDGDGHGDPQSSITACAVPPGHVTNDDDCYDENPQVHPGQVAYFFAHRGDGSFDYNCDGIEQPQWGVYSIQTSSNAAAPTGCLLLEEACSSPNSAEGWYDSPPACGQSQLWVQCTLFIVNTTPVCNTEYGAQFKNQMCL